MKQESLKLGFFLVFLFVLKSVILFLITQERFFNIHAVLLDIRSRCGCSKVHWTSEKRGVGWGQGGGGIYILLHFIISTYFCIN